MRPSVCLCSLAELQYTDLVQLLGKEEDQIFNLHG